MNDLQDRRIGHVDVVALEGPFQCCPRHRSSHRCCLVESRQDLDHRVEGDSFGARLAVLAAIFAVLAVFAVLAAVFAVLAILVIGRLVEALDLLRLQALLHGDVFQHGLDALGANPPRRHLHANQRLDELQSSRSPRSRLKQ